MPIRLLLVSHAATVATREGRFPDDPLARLSPGSRGPESSGPESSRSESSRTDSGRTESRTEPGRTESSRLDSPTLDASALAQAQAARERLPGPAGIRALTSPAPAARETARALGLLDAAPVAALADLDYGRWHDRALKDLAREEPDALAAWCRDPAAAPHGGESFVELVGRVAQWLDGLEEEADVIALSHAAVLRAALVHALDAPPASFSRIEIAPLTVIELRRAGRGWSWWPR